MRRENEAYKEVLSQVSEVVNVSEKMWIRRRKGYRTSAWYISKQKIYSSKLYNRYRGNYKISWKKDVSNVSFCTGRL